MKNQLPQPCASMCCHLCYRLKHCQWMKHMRVVPTPKSAYCQSIVTIQTHEVAPTYEKSATAPAWLWALNDMALILNMGMTKALHNTMGEWTPFRTEPSKTVGNHQKLSETVRNHQSCAATCWLCGPVWPCTSRHCHSFYQLKHWTWTKHMQVVPAQQISLPATEQSTATDWSTCGWPLLMKNQPLPQHDCWHWIKWHLKQMWVLSKPITTLQAPVQSCATMCSHTWPCVAMHNHVWPCMATCGWHPFKKTATSPAQHCGHPLTSPGTRFSW